ncbi:UbiH/UbiF/VisC/COQ6 family ubiquinone biosynthesis hydroxylase [Halomonas sp. 18H]|uniref:UbiH/UbiF/VisC/COQ6 family ubiquinone biosynthesis hydroxylase n=1 Tax=Halomonas almeriensis TaxID=308163 RepID=UPI00222EAF2A|nr:MULTISPECIES: UbiH/UbiF/VisC/COQ6 family ubiquinone biosynthesis hydroxylase [Halomonas]MCW4152033.1 UbiH/UbiF/VisC/COQ6 family ubiquinone biosynthesis hydroxylase [Halomonas sp. 18H]MDN3552469.1 UbiH/UbiF/VisC/COQ6 family ubiquinone biosynthesis hydroxylase [Halomonas almeriensis]
MTSETAESEVIIVGAGMVGATLACLLGQAGVDVTLMDAREGPVDAEAAGRGAADPRVSALTPVSQRLLEGLGIWQAMQQRRVTPYHHMQVWDAEGSGEIRFSADQAGLPVLGHIVENAVVLAALEARLAALPSVQRRFAARVAEFSREQATSVVTLADGSRLAAPLVVAADGARSPLRDMAGINTRAADTGQVAVVTTVQTERPHDGVARQAFLADGPLAFLPLTLDEHARHCSIVWSTSPDRAEHLTGLSSEALGTELRSGIDACLGQVDVVDSAVSFALTQRHAEQYTRPGLALVGDAAHSIHPLAGQGANLGLMDVAVLAEELLVARRRGLGLGDEVWLARYARRRRGDNALMLRLMDAFRVLFGTRHPAWTLARNLGLSSVDRLGPLKRLLMQQAAGRRGRLPASCR